MRGYNGDMKNLAAILAICLCPLFLSAEEIDFAFRPVPPYVMVDEEGRFSGLEYEIIVAALAAAGHTVRPSALPLARLVGTFNAGAVPAAAPLLPGTAKKGSLSEVYLEYRNVAVALKSSGIRITSLEDLKGRAIVAFQTATTVLGPEYAAVVDGNPLYAETADQILQIRQLFTGRVELIVGDSRLLRYYVRTTVPGPDPTGRIVEFELFPPTRYRAGFADARRAADFNAGLAAIRKNGTYAAIVAKYAGL